VRRVNMGDHRLWNLTALAKNRFLFWQAKLLAEKLGMSSSYSESST
jgi:hypothetical protein